MRARRAGCPVPATTTVPETAAVPAASGWPPPLASRGCAGPPAGGPCPRPTTRPPPRPAGGCAAAAVATPITSTSETAATNFPGMCIFRRPRATTGLVGHVFATPPVIRIRRRQAELERPEDQGPAAGFVGRLDRQPGVVDAATHVQHAGALLDAADDAP